MDPTHDDIRQYVSELIATGSPIGPVGGYFILAPYGALVALSSAAMVGHSSWQLKIGGLATFIFGLCVFLLAFCPCDLECGSPSTTWSDVVHKYVSETSIGFAVLGPVWMLFDKSIGNGCRAIASMATLALAGCLVCRHIGMPVGILERVFLAVYNVWLIGALFLLRTGNYAVVAMS